MRFKSLSLALAGAALLGVQSAPAAAPTAAQALQLAPVQKGVEYDIPAEDDAKKCTIKAEKVGKQTGWIVREADGQILRMFTDTNNDNIVDRWSYYLNGLEVYRDIDANFNGKADQYRWFHTAGSRWGLDRDEDGRIESWKIISAEEVAAEVVAALQTRDVQRFERLLLADAELKALGVGPAHEKDLAAKLKGAADAFRELAGRKNEIDAQTRFVNFGGSKPGIVPAGTDESTQDLIVYENAAAMVEHEGKHKQVYIGTLVRVGNLWRLIDVPQFQSGTELVSSGYFFRTDLSARPDVESAAATAGAEKLQKVMEELEKLEQTIASAGKEQQEKLNLQRADLLTKLADDAEDDAHRTQWLRQLADTLSAAVQSGTFEKGIDRLRELEGKLAEAKADDPLHSYVKFRRMTAEYSRDLQKPKADFAKVQAAWLETLEAFVKEFPKSPDSAEAMLQLAIAQEFAGEEDQAKEWYARILAEQPDSAPAKKALGAKTRLESVGKTISFSGQGLDGKTVKLSELKGKLVLIQYWATWCEPCKNDMEEIKELYAKYAGRGFEVIGVNLDNDRAEAAALVKAERLAWPQIHETGGLESRPANELGILTLPTMLLVGEDGRVLNRNIHAGELETELRKELK